MLYSLRVSIIFFAHQQKNLSIYLCCFLPDSYSAIFNILSESPWKRSAIYTKKTSKSPLAKKNNVDVMQSMRKSVSVPSFTWSAAGFAKCWIWMTWTLAGNPSFTTQQPALCSGLSMHSTTLVLFKYHLFYRHSCPVTVPVAVR